MSDAEKPASAPAGQPMSVQADPSITPGVYSNLMMVSHRKEEFVLDFLFVQPQSGPSGEAIATMRARVIASPGHTRRILRALEENLRRYESTFGPIEDVPDLPMVLQ